MVFEFDISDYMNQGGSQKITLKSSPFEYCPEGLNLHMIVKIDKALPKGKDADEVVKALSNVLTKDIKNYMVKSFATFTKPNHTFLVGVI